MNAKNNGFKDILSNKKTLDDLGISEEELVPLMSQEDGVQRIVEGAERKRTRQKDREKREREPSILVDDNEEMDRARRNIEQDGHRKFARVNAREHHEREQDKQVGLEAQAQSDILQHPALDNQRFDGIDPSVNPEPALNSESRKEFDNARREQEMEKQLRLGNMPKFSSAPKPDGF